MEQERGVCQGLEIKDGVVVRYTGDSADVTIPSGVIAIGNEAFWRCGHLTSIHIPDGVTSIGNAAFFQCTSLAKITLPRSVTKIADFAFKGCTALNYIMYPKSAQWGFLALMGCSFDLVEVTY